MSETPVEQIRREAREAGVGWAALEAERDQLRQQVEKLQRTSRFNLTQLGREALEGEG